MSEYPFTYTYDDAGKFTSTGLTDFSEGVLKLGKIDKQITYNGDITNPTDTHLEYVAPFLRQKNEYGEDNELTCVWTSDINENYSKYSPAFKVNDAVISPTVFGDATVVNKGASDGIYTIIENRGYLDGSDNFVKNNNYLIYVKYGSPNRLMIFDFAANIWFLETTYDDPNLWTDGQATGVSGSTLISNFTETIGSFFRAASNVDLTYQPDNNEFADISNGLVSFSDDFFVGKKNFYYEADHKINLFTSAADIFYIRYTSTANNIILRFLGSGTGPSSGSFIELEINDNASQKTKINYRIDTDILDTKGDGTGFGAGDELNISFEYQDKDVNPNGNVWLKINGILVASAVLGESITGNAFTAMYFDQQSRFYVKNFRFQPELKHAGANFTPETSLPAVPFMEASHLALIDTYGEVGDLQSIVSVAETNATNAQYIVNGYYYNGAAWVVSDGSFAQSNDAATILANASSFVLVDDSYSLTIVFPDGVTRGQIEGADLIVNGQQYWETASATTNLSLPNSGFISFSPIEFTPSEYTIFKYAFLIGGVLYWHNQAAQGGQGRWEAADGTIATANSKEELTPEIMAKLDQPGFFKLLTYIQSTVDPETGFQNPASPSISQATIVFDYSVPTLAEPNKVVIYGLDRNTCALPTDGIGDGSKVGDVVYTFVVRNPKAIKHTGTLIRKGDCVSIALGSAKVIADGIFELETLRDTPSLGNVYKYEYLLVKTTTIDNRGSIAYKVEEDSLGYAEAPNQTEVLITDLDLSDQPGVNF